MNKRPDVVFVLGGPGAGKGTQCQFIVKEYGYIHLSAGELLRAERKKPDSEVGTLIEKHIQEGSIVPVEITCRLLQQAMNEAMSHDAAASKFLIDGFPRNQDNLDGWQREMADKVNLLLVLFFDCSEDYSHDLRVKLCSIETYNQSTRPIVEHYNKLNKVRNISADGSPEQVFAEVQRVFDALK